MRAEAFTRFERRAEAELLLCCARTSISAEQRAKIRALLKEEIDWRCLREMADRHGLLPLLYSNLNAACAEAIPETCLDELQAFFRKNTISNLLLAGEMRGIVEMFESHGIIAVPFKGPTLALAAYKDIALRQFHDIDILLRRRDVLKAKALLISRGYRPDYELSAAQEAAHLKCDCERNFKGGIYVELQWEIVPRNYSFKINDESLWERLGRVEFEGRALRALSPEDLLLLLCAHGTKHAWTRLAWICDVAELVSARSDMNWSELTERAKRLGGERMLMLGLSLACDLLGARIPQEMIEKVNADRTVKRLGAEVSERLFGATGEGLQVIKHSLFFIRARERASDRALSLVRMAFAPTVKDVTFIGLPRALSFLYYALRPARLLVKYGLGLSRR
ncbi:MAG TPA: nucleotidyltransferase family protein [Blastocatellia bacterium]|nr:nucleotidyltransferase family protein [Blastocatellia bacterium]